jgi:hypothetical protein
VPEALFLIATHRLHGGAGLLRLINVILAAGYFTYMLAAHGGQTLGKRIAGIAVVRPDGSPLTYGRAFLRWVGYLVSMITMFIGFFMAAFTDRKRALHDYIADTRVVQVRAVSRARQFFVLQAALLFPAIVVLGIVAAILIPIVARYQTLVEDPLVMSNLYLLRNSAELFYNDHQTYPSDFTAIIRDQHVKPLPIGGHPATDQVQLYGNEVCAGTQTSDQMIIGAKLNDAGGWGYVNDPKSPCFGHVFVNCTHIRSGGKEWYRY